MTPATWPREEPLDERLLVVDPRTGALRDARLRDLPRWLEGPDVLVVNDAATLPASFTATTPHGAAVELRLAGRREDARWYAVLFGGGDWRTRTEHRPAPPRVAPGESLRIAPELAASVVEVDARSPRLLVVTFSASGEELWRALYRHGRPVQYAHVARPLELWHAQTPFASRPWAVEMPSAGRPLAWRLVASLRARGVRLASVTHAAGLSSTGDPSLDAALPLPERFDVPANTVRAIRASRAEGGRVIAIGTTVVRALEGSAALHGGELVAGKGTTNLRIDAGFRPRVTDGLLTGLHDASSSHRDLVRAFAPDALLERAWVHAESRGYLDHEFGDSWLVLPSRYAT